MPGQWSRTLRLPLWSCKMQIPVSFVLIPFRYMQILAAVHMQIGKANNFLPFLLSHQSFRRVLWPPLTPPPPSKPRDPAIFMQILIFKSDCQVYSTCFKFGAHLSLISPCVNIVNQVDLLVNPLINQGV